MLAPQARLRAPGAVAGSHRPAPALAGPAAAGALRTQAAAAAAAAACTDARSARPSCSAEEVRERFEKYGPIRDVYLPKDFCE